MKYMLLVYSDEAAWSEAEQAQCYAESIQLTHQLQANGQYLGASPLEPVAAATSFRIRNGKQLITDGPFAEKHEQLGGYFLIDARDLNEAINIAGRIPAAHKGTIEIRPVMELSGLPADPTEKNLADLSV
ncbi:MAG: YciI family protein [Cyanobacteria bacterium P01_D01_bin.14]